MPDLPTVIKIKYIHNHPIQAADVLKHRYVAPDVRDKFLELFQNGYSPSRALDIHKYDLQIEHGENYVFKSGDRAVCPDIQYCYRLVHYSF
jgi:hypothetical protein